MRFAAHGHNLGARIGNSTRFIFFTADTVNHMPFGIPRARFGYGTDDVDLIKFITEIASVNINDMIGVVHSEHGIGPIPVNVVYFIGLCQVDKKCQSDE